MAPKPPHGDDPLVYPVEFEGYPGTDDAGISVRHVNVRINGLRWCAYDLQSVRKVKRLGQPLNQAEKHKTQRIRYFYNQEDAREYEGERGFILHPAVPRSQAPDTIGTENPETRKARKARDTTTADLRGKAKAAEPAPVEEPVAKGASKAKASKAADA